MTLRLKVKEIIRALEEAAPLALQESYDNSGLIVGDPESEISSLLLCIDLNEAVIEEAIQKGCGLIVSHHPIIFKGLKRLTPDGYVERVVIKAIRNGIAIAAMHTNLDNSHEGVNKKIADKLGLKSLSILEPKEGMLQKIITFIPESHAEVVRAAMFEAGAGQIGLYDACSFNVKGSGTFRAGAGASPFVGQMHQVHNEAEIKVEMIVPAYRASTVVKAMLAAHPYEEVAWDLITLANRWNEAGSGMVGYLDEPLTEQDFLSLLQHVFGTPALRHTELTGKLIRKVAVCGGSGSFLIKSAERAHADAMITADVKYHDFFDVMNKLLLIDAGHYETEQFTKELMSDILTENFPNFAVLFSEVNTNPVRYYFK